MKEKKLRKKIKASKKGIALAAISLIMSGNLAAISTPVLATENSNTVLTNKSDNKNESYGQLFSGYPVAQSPWNGSVYYQGRDSWGETSSRTYDINSWQSGNLNGNVGVVPSVPNEAIDGQILLPKDSTKPIIIRASDFEYGNDDKTGRTAEYTLNKDITNFLPNRSYTTTLSCNGFGFGSIELITTNGDKTVTTGSRSLGSFTANTNIIPSTKSGKLSLKINSGQVEEYYSRYGEITPNITVNLTYSKEWQAVDSLFTSTDHSELAPGITSEKVQEVKQQVANISNNQDAAEMNAAISKAEQLVAEDSQNQIVQEATDKVNGLFNGENLADGVNQDKINEAQAAVDKVTDEAKKQELQNKIDKAQELLNKQDEQAQIVQEATDKVNGLFNGENLADGVNQDKINEAQAAVDKVTDEAKKQELQNKIDKAQELLNKQDEQAQIVQEATDKVNGLFNGENLADGVNQDKINEAQAAVDKVTDEAKKQELQNKIDKAQELLDKQDEQFAITSVDPYKEGISQYVTGTYKGKDAGYIRLMVNGEKTALVSMNNLPEGTFKYYMSGLKATDKVSVVIYGKDYKQLAEKEVPIEKGKVPVEITSVNPYKEGISQFVTGTYVGDDAGYIRLMVNGEKTALVSMNNLPEGKFEYYMSGLKATDKVSVVIYGKDYKQLAEKEVPIEKAKVPVEITSVDPYKEGISQFVTGTYTGDDAAYMRLVVNGEKKALVSMNNLPEGTFKYYMSGLKATDKASVVIYGSDYKQVAEQQVSIEK